MKPVGRPQGRALHARAVPCRYLRAGCGFLPHSLLPSPGAHRLPRAPPGPRLSRARADRKRRVLRKRRALRTPRAECRIGIVGQGLCRWRNRLRKRPDERRSRRAERVGPLGEGGWWRTAGHRREHRAAPDGVRGGAAALILAMHVVSQRRAAGGADLPLGRRDADGEGRHSLLVRNLMQSLRPARYMSLPAGRATANGRSPLGWRFRQGAFSAGAFGMAGCTVMLSRRSPTPGP